MPEDDRVESILELHITPKSNDVAWNGQTVAGRGFSAIGYHHIITKDGRCWPCRSEELQGAHCYGQNEHSIGICLTGKDRFTLAQFRTLLDKLEVLKEKYNLKDSDIYGHYAFSDKTCPNFNVNL